MEGPGDPSAPLPVCRSPASAGRRNAISESVNPLSRSLEDAVTIVVQDASPTPISKALRRSEDGLERKDSFALYELLAEGYNKSKRLSQELDSSPQAKKEGLPSLVLQKDTEQEEQDSRIATLGLSPRGRRGYAVDYSFNGDRIPGLEYPSSHPGPFLSAVPEKPKHKLSKSWKSVKEKMKSKRHLNEHKDGTLREKDHESELIVPGSESDNEKEKEEKEKEQDDVEKTRESVPPIKLLSLSDTPIDEVKLNVKRQALSKRLGTDRSFTLGSSNKPFMRISGWMWKQGMNAMSRWKKRWFVLSDNRLYYSARPEADFINYLLFNPASKVAQCTTKKHEHCLQIQLDYTERVYVLATDTREELDMWLAALDDLMKHLEKRFSDQKESIIKHIFTPQRIYRSASGSRIFSLACDGPSSTREVLDVLVESVKGLPQGKNTYLSLTLGAQTFSTWRLKKSDDFSKDPWKGIGCTFTEEGCRGNVATGSGWWDSEVEPLYLHVALYRRCKKLSAKELLVGEDKLDVTQVQREQPATYTAVLKAKAKHRSSDISESSRPTIVQLKLQKSYGINENAMLHNRGLPSTKIPLRLDTGDILLFSNTNLLSYSTKIFTASQWDHVGMVVRWWNSELKLFEATSEQGVEMYNFDDRLEYLQSVCKIAVRQLNASRTPEMLDSLFIFIDEVAGRPFQRNRLSMVKAAGGLNSTADLSSLFCSELTAEAYKRMGLLDPKCVSSNFLPRNWADKSNSGLMLSKGVSLDRKFIFKKVEVPPELSLHK